MKLSNRFRTSTFCSLVMVAVVPSRVQSAGAYVDAIPGPGGNTVRASDGHTSAWYTDPSADVDSLWGRRALGNAGTLFEASAGEDAPMIRTRLSDLTPGGTYQLYLHYWSSLGENGGILAGYSPDALQAFDRLGTSGAVPGLSGALNLDLGGASSLRDPRGGPAYAISGGAGLVADANDLWNAVTTSDMSPGTLQYADGGPAPEIGINTGRETGLATRVIGWSLGDLVSRSGGSPEGLQADALGGWTSTVLQTYVRENAAETTIRVPAFAIENLPAGSYALFVVADNTYHTTAAGTNRSYWIYAGVDNAASATTGFAGFARQSISNTSWNTWQLGVNYARFDVGIAAGQRIVVVSEEKTGLQDHSLINAIQIVPLGQSGRVELRADLGLAVAAANGQIDVFVDDVTGERSSYDGVSHVEVASAPPVTSIVLSNNGGWCWYQDERALLTGDRLIVGAVANSAGTNGASRGGNIEVATYDIVSGAAPVVSVLHPNLQNDDHDLPALLTLADGRYLAVYARHSNDGLIRVRISTNASDSTVWDPEFTYTRPNNVTYSNLFRLSAENGGSGRIYDFYRGEGFDPNFVISDDDGRTWSYGGRLLYNPTNDNSTRPYLKYASNNVDTIHFINTEAHPDSSGYTSIYHGYIRDMRAYRSDGTLIGDLRSGPIEATTPTRVFAGNASTGEGWTADLHLDAAGRPYAGYSVHLSNDDHRYRYARWDGSRWIDHEIAFAGTRLYVSQNNYTGLISLDPQNLNRVFISTNADPVSGAPLVSSADGRRHWEIFRGLTADMGATWSWTPVTADSTTDNLRPSVPISSGGYNALIWMRGTYTSYTSYDLDMVATIFVAADFDMDEDVDGDDFAVFAACATGSGAPYGPDEPPSGCSLPLSGAGWLPADVDRDRDVDQDDFGVFQRCLSGSDYLPDVMCMQ